MGQIGSLEVRKYFGSWTLKVNVGKVERKTHKS